MDNEENADAHNHNHDHDHPEEEDAEFEVDSEVESDNDGFDGFDVNTDRLPLVPSEYESLDEALQNFVTVFESRYGPTHPFCYLSTLQEALTEAFEAPGRDIVERKPLAIYLHNDNSVACNIFAQQVMCNDNISPLLKAQFITWGWDFTYPANRTRFFDWLDILNIKEISHTIRSIPRDNYPILVALVKDHGTVIPASICTGHNSVNVCLRKLMDALDMFLNIKNQASNAERDRLEREHIRAEQLAAYEESKAQDRAKQEERERLAREELEAEKARIREEEEVKNLQEKLKASLPSEPAESSSKDVITIRLRFPTGDTQVRRFRMDEPVKWLVTYCESIGYDMKTYRLWTSDVPKKDVATLDNNKSFRDLKWPLREAITVEEK